MTHAHIISANPHSLLSQGLTVALQQTMQYQTAAISYADVLPTPSYSDILPIFLCQANEEIEIFDSIQTVRKTQDKICLVMPLSMRAEQIKKLLPQCKTVIVSTNTSIKDLHQYIQELYTADRQYIFSHDMLDILMAQMLTTTRQQVSKEISHREQEIIDCAEKGYNLQQTAEALNLSRNTIATYRSKLLQKTGTKSINQLIAQNNG